MFPYRRVKTDDKDAADLLPMGRLPEAWIAPPRVREIRELVRWRQKLVNARTSAKTQVQAVLAKVCLQVPVTDLFGRAGGDWLAGLSLHGPYRARVASLMRLIAILDGEISDLEKHTARTLADDPGYRAV